MNDLAVKLPSRSGGATEFGEKLIKSGTNPLTRAALGELQVNLGRLCNQACHHCHVDAGPKRTEIMSWPVMERILGWARQNHIQRVDLTGGAPELNPHFRQFVDKFLDMGATVTSRCNLTVLFEPGQEDLAEWYAQRKIRLVCSLPCYSEENVDTQRGKGVFTKSIAALQKLNSLGYAHQGDLVLDLAYNPGGAFLPPSQPQLETDYKTRLKKEFAIVFSNLLSLTNLPINRFRHALERDGQLEKYEQLLQHHFNANTIPGLMCRHLVSVDWLGEVFDCDFNQMIDLALGAAPRRKLWELDGPTLKAKPVAIGNHCFGCTAGAGSSCGGTLV
ncbi:MAG TPA: radical SAM/Cys-rich domain protein [Acidiferrobacteraceae bacterium]|nr:radical SAM/Cys-rich domain protein [Acidiferrobacteraceae bacterium]